MDVWLDAYRTRGGAGLRAVLGDVPIADDEETAPLDDDELKRLVPGCVVQTYTAWSRNGVVRDGKTVLLYELEDKTTGHWVGLMKFGNYAEYFDALGYPAGKPMHWLNAGRRASLKEDAGQAIIEALRRLRVAGVTVRENGRDYQNRSPNEATCGRHVACRLASWPMTLDAYSTMVSSYGGSPDAFVTAATDFALHRHMHGDGGGS